MNTVTASVGISLDIIDKTSATVDETHAATRTGLLYANALIFFIVAILHHQHLRSSQMLSVRLVGYCWSVLYATVCRLPPTPSLNYRLHTFTDSGISVKALQPVTVQTAKVMRQHPTLLARYENLLFLNTRTCCF